MAIISEAVWRARFGGDPGLVGRRVDISGAAVLIVGVMPASFAFPFSQTRVWRPLDLDHPSMPMARPGATAYAYARLASNVPREDVARVAADIAHATDPSTSGQIVVLRPLGDGYLDAYSAGIVKVASVGAGLVFLLLCASVTNLMLARLGARRHEFALCSALGASRGRLLRQALLEQLLIGASAGVLGLSAGAALVNMAATILPTEILRRTLNVLDLDMRAVLATSVFSATTVVLAGLLPAWIGTRHDASPELQLTPRGATSERKARRLTTTLLVVQLALAVALSVAAGIQLRSFVNLLQADRGIDAEKLASFIVQLPTTPSTDGASRYAVAEHLRSSVQRLPGIDGAALSFGVPPSGGSLYFYDVLPDVPGATAVALVMNSYHVTPDFFQVYGIQLLEGRAFQPGDANDAVIVSRSMAKELWPTTSAIGRMLRFDDGRTFRVVGVTREILNPSLDPRSDEPELYERLVSSDSTLGAAPAIATTSVSLTVRCGEGCPPLDTLRTHMASASASASVGVGKRVRDDYATALARPRTGAVVAIAFAGIALLAVGAGLFAVLTRVAAQRQREFGIRLALGATPADIRGLVHSNSLWIAVMGIGTGVALAWALGRILAAVQYQVHVADPLTWAIVIVAIGATAFAAAWHPSRQATRASPMALLSEE